MQRSIPQILESSDFSREDLITLLGAEGRERELLFRKAAEVKAQYVGNKVYFRGLVELSNICSKNCYYCGIRSGNKVVDRYFVTDDAVLEAAR